MTSLFSLEGRVALVTGASSGLGRHFARVLHEAGATVVLAARRVDRIEAEAARLGERAHAMAMDVADEASIAAGFERIAGTVPPCDVIVNNAGISGSSLLLQMDTQEWDDVIRVNLRAPFLVAREAARRLVAAKRPGSIVNIASILGVRVSPALAPYMASKAGLIHLTRSMAFEFARYGIRVNALCPGYFATEINDEFLGTEYAQAMIKRTPQRRIGDLRDLTGPLLLLASDAGAFMTGEALVVDGGQSINSL
jgi:NAD(P)-dependent dehydrogenase (short-subunit alcohol dehydrogenase family)